jgi:hypothetical protein
MVLIPCGRYGAGTKRKKILALEKSSDKRRRTSRRTSPYHIHSIVVESPEPNGPFGAKGVDEIALVPVPAALANVIVAASGQRIRRLPMTPERVLDGLLEPDDEA